MLYHVFRGVTVSLNRIKGNEQFMKKIALLAFVATFIMLECRAIELPKPPDGFIWQEIPELKAAFLKPNGWFFKQEMQKGTLAYFITKENLEQNGQFDTGLTINVFKFKKDSAVDHGKVLIGNMALKHHVEMWSRTYGPFKEFGCELTDTDASGTIRMHALTIANPKTNTLYLFIFESPIANADAAWKIGKQIMDTLAIDDDV
jgi:hypothetical protein